MTRGGQRPRHVPMRRCVACRQSAGKRSLVRVVRDQDGTVDIDRTGKRNGRGAYLCQRKGCWDIGLQRGALEHALKGPISSEDRERLRQIGEAYPAELQEPPPE